MVLMINKQYLKKCIGVLYTNLLHFAITCPITLFVILYHLVTVLYNSDAGYKIQSRRLPLHLETLIKFTHYITTLMHSNKSEGLGQRKHN